MDKKIGPKGSIDQAAVPKQAAPSSSSSLPGTDLDSNKIKYDPNNININYTKPIDIFFQRLNTILKSIVKDPNAPIKSTDKSQLVSQNNAQTLSKPKTRPELLYDALTPQEVAQTKERIKQLETQNQINYPETETFVLISFFCQSILKVRTFLDQNVTSTTTPKPAAAAKSKDHDPNDMIEISLNDMKIFNTILNLIVIDGIYPCLSPGVGVPLNLRIKNRQNLSSSTLVGSGTSTNAKAPVTPLLKYGQLYHILNDTFVPILSVKDDVRNLILIGSYIPDFLTISCELAFNPASANIGLPPAIRAQSLRNFQFVMGQMDTYSLYLNFTSLIRPKAPSWIMLAASKMLAMLPINRSSNGVLCLIEFISGVRDKPDINIEDLDKATKVLKSIPKNMNSNLYYQKIGTQLIAILALQERENTVAATIHILSQLLQQKKEMVEVGVQDQIIETISPFSLPESQEKSAEIVKLNNNDSKIIVTSTNLKKALSAFTSLLRSAQPLELIHEIGKFCLVSLWTLLCYLIETKRPFEELKSIIVAFIALQPEYYPQIQSLVLRNFVKSNASNRWVWGAADDGFVEIRKADDNSLTGQQQTGSSKFGNESLPVSNTNSSLDQQESSEDDGMKQLESQLELFTEISDRVSVFSTQILEPLHHHFVDQLKTKDTFISSFFVLLIKEWLTFRHEESSALDKSQDANSEFLNPLDFVKTKDSKYGPVGTQSASSNDDQAGSELDKKTVGALVNAKMLQMLYTNHKDSLFESPTELLAVIHSVLEDYVSSIERAKEKRDKIKKLSQEKHKKQNMGEGFDLNTSLQKDLQTEREREEKQQLEEHYVPSSIRQMIGIQEIEDLDEEKPKDTSAVAAESGKSRKPMIQELDDDLDTPTLDVDVAEADSTDTGEVDGDAEEIINLCFSLLLAIAEDLSKVEKNDTNNVEMTTDEDEAAEQDNEEANIKELRTLEAVLPQLEYIIQHSPENLLKGKAIACKDTVVETLHKHFPNEELPYSGSSSTANTTISTHHSKLEEKENSIRDTRQLSKAIKLMDDPSVPIQANGLYILKTLVENESPAVENWPMVVQIYLSKLKSEDSFVYINAVKGLFAVCDKHGEPVIKYLTAMFAGIVPDDKFMGNIGDVKNKKEKEDTVDRVKLSDSYIKSIINYMTTDETLRLGEVLVKVVKNLSIRLRGSLANTILQTMIKIVNNTLKTDRVNEDNNSGNVVGGTDNKFDDLIRMSSMSIIASCYESNFLGLVDHLAETLDCVIGILQFENKPVQNPPSLAKPIISDSKSTNPKSPKPSEQTNQRAEEEEEQERIKKDNLQVEKEIEASGGVFMRRAALNLLAAIFFNMPATSPSTLSATFSGYQQDINHQEDSNHQLEAFVSATQMRSIKTQLGIAVHDTDPVIRANAEKVGELVRDLELYG